MTRGKGEGDLGVWGEELNVVRAIRIRIVCLHLIYIFFNNIFFFVYMNNRINTMEKS